jgi:hypothetical protein
MKNKTDYTLDDLKSLLDKQWFYRMPNGGWKETGIYRKRITTWRDREEHEVFDDLIKREQLGDPQEVKEKIAGKGSWKNTKVEFRWVKKASMFKHNPYTAPWVS